MLLSVTREITFILRSNKEENFVMLVGNGMKLGIAVLLGGHSVSIAQDAVEPGNRIDLRTSAYVRQITDTLKFDYRLGNGISAKQDVIEFSLISSPEVHVQEKMSPHRWDAVAVYQDILMLRWLAHPRDSIEGYENPLKPGNSLSGFSFKAKSLPGIISFYAEGDHPIPKFDPGMATDSIPGYSDLTPYGPGIIGRTVGPVPLPDPLIYVAILDTLLSYTRQSADLGWLGKGQDDDCDDDERPDDGIVKNIEQRLQKAKRELAKRDSVQACKELEKLVQKVERIWKRSQEEEKKHRKEGWGKRDQVIITSEAYALLKYNTEYLIDRLPREKKKKH
jgi:hypothetical protein